MAKRAQKSMSDLSPEGKALKAEGKAWIDRIDAAWKREETWSKDAEKAVKAYTSETEGTGKLYDYNILHANVETIVPAIINSAPIPNIRRRFADDDPVAKTVGDIIERAIMVQVDDSRLDAELEGQAHEGFLAGRGVLRLRFHADTQETESSALDDAEDAAEDDGEDEVETDDPRSDTPDDVQISGERITFEAVSWRDYQHGPAKRWEHRPWESFRHVMPCEDAEEFADKALMGTQTEPGGRLFGEAGSDTVIYEIWNRKRKEVIFISDKGDVLKRIPDPLGWSGFFPTIRPVQPIEIVGRLMPVNPFSVYKKLADELDVLTKRISVITGAMKVKGAFLGGVANDLDAWAKADDNELLAINNVEMIAQLQGGINGAITWWPAEKFQPVLAELFRNRDLTKQAIYEITGISDIVRGASAASETATAQQIKTQWGSLRIRKMQRMIERSARDLFVAMSEIIPAKFSLRTLEQMTGIPILPAPTDTPEQVQQKMAVAQLLQQPLATYYRVDVESNSTVRADLTQKKADVAEFMGAAAQYWQGLQMIAQGDPEAMLGALEVFAAAVRNYDLGKSAEDAVEKMISTARAKAEQARNAPPPEPPPDPAMVKAEAEAQKMQADAATQQQQAETDFVKAQADAVVKVKDAETQAAEAELQRELKRAEDYRKSLTHQQELNATAELKALDVRIKETQLLIEEARLMQMGAGTETTTGPDGQPSGR